MMIVRQQQIKCGVSSPVSHNVTGDRDRRIRFMSHKKIYVTTGQEDVQDSLALQRYLWRAAGARKMSTPQRAFVSAPAHAAVIAAAKAARQLAARQRQRKDTKIHTTHTYTILLSLSFHDHQKIRCANEQSPALGASSDRDPSSARRRRRARHQRVTMGKVEIRRWLAAAATGNASVAMSIQLADNLPGPVAVAGDTSTWSISGTACMRRRRFSIRPDRCTPGVQWQQWQRECR